MTKAKIESAAELRREIIRLKALSREQELLIKKDIAGLKESLTSVRLTMNAIASIFSLKATDIIPGIAGMIRKKGLLRNGIAMGISFVMKRYFVKAEQKIESLVLHFTEIVLDKLKKHKKEHADSEKNDKT